MFADDCDECSVNDDGGDDDASRLHIYCLCDCDCNGVVVKIL